MQTFALSPCILYAIHLYCVVNFLSNFKIPSIPPTTNKTIRFPNDIISAVEDAINGKDCTFSAFVVSAVRAALEDLNKNSSK